MGVDGVATQSATGVDGNTYTKAVSSDQLTNADFLKLMLQEMKQQDPTKPMDTDKLMDSQLKMSTIQSNMDMSKSLAALQQSYAASSLATASNMIGHIVEDGSTDDKGVSKSYKVETIENKDGKLYANARQVTGMKDALADSQSKQLVLYDADGYIYDGDKKTNYRVALDPNKRFTYNDDKTLKIVDTNNNVVTDQAITSKYVYGGSSALYADNTTNMPLSNIQEVR